MGKERLSCCGRWQNHVRRRLLAGLAVLVPFGFTSLVLRFVFRVTSGLLSPVIVPLAPRIPALAVAAVSVVIVVVLLYLAGLLTTYLLGRRLIALGESVVERVPVVKTIYGASKQVVWTLSLPNRKAFKSVVWVEFPRPGLLALGFVTGRIQDEQGDEFHEPFIPTTPDPTRGFLEVVPCGQVRETSMAIDEALKMIISGGIVSPGRLDGATPDTPAVDEDPCWW
jgi:uncharacterized membrane protein